MESAGQFLERHALAGHGANAVPQVLAQVDDVFGEPLLVVATGSVLAGFGRPTSDIDVYVVVPEEVASTRGKAAGRLAILRVVSAVTWATSRTLSLSALVSTIW